MAAGEFIVERLKNLPSDTVSYTSSMVHSVEREASDVLTGLVSVHAKRNKSGGEVASLVDALIESAPILKEWQVIAELILTRKREWFGALLSITF